MEVISGARWWKFDFHNHTPASTDYGKGANQVALKSTTPKQWLLNYMVKGIDCVAITDHNSGSWIDLLKTALNELEHEKPEHCRPLYIFPGVEISCNHNCHVLALFDLDANTGTINELLGKVDFRGDKGDSNGVTTKSVEEVLNIVINHGGVAIPAHVDKNCGLFEVINGFSLKQSLEVDGLLAIELVDKNYSKPDIYRQTKLKLTEVIGTDSHFPEQVGTNFTWIKMHEPSLEALKLALHDGDDAVVRKEDSTADPNFVKNRYFIKSLKVKDGYKAGRGDALCAEFSPWLSSIIGGRGSGKSSLINYFRIGMDRQKDMPVDIQKEFEDFKKIGSKQALGMLTDSTVLEIELYKDGSLHKICWSKGTNYYNVTSWEPDKQRWSESAIVSNVAEIFPIQIFS